MKLTQRFLLSLGHIVPMRYRPFFYRLSGMKIGQNTRISKGLYVDRPEGVVIGDNCFLNHFVHLHNGADSSTYIKIGNNVFIGPEAMFFCASHKIGGEEQRAGNNEYGSIVVEDGVWVGANVTVFPNVVIGKGGVIGACAMVTKSTNPNKLCYGSPAKEIKDL